MKAEEVLDEPWLEIPMHLISGILTPRRVELIQELRRNGPYPTQSALAQGLGRARSHVSVDLSYLEGLGLVDRQDGIRAPPVRIVVT